MLKGTVYAFLDNWKCMYDFFKDPESFRIGNRYRGLTISHKCTKEGQSFIAVYGRNGEKVMSYVLKEGCSFVLEV